MDQRRLTEIGGNCVGPQTAGGKGESSGLQHRSDAKSGSHNLQTQATCEDQKWEDRGQQGENKANCCPVLNVLAIDAIYEYI